MPYRHSATLAVNERLRARRAAGEPVLHLAFGEAGLPVLPELAAVLADSVRHNEYAPVTGESGGSGGRGRLLRAPRDCPPIRTASCWRRAARRCCSRCWRCCPVTWCCRCRPGSATRRRRQLAGKRVIGVPDPGPGGRCAGSGTARSPRWPRHGPPVRGPAMLVLTLPDNPTGTLAPARPARRGLPDRRPRGPRRGLRRDLPGPVPRSGGLTSPAELLPERVVVTSRAEQEPRPGRLPDRLHPPADGPLGDQLLPSLVGVASEVWSSLAAPMQHVAAAALAEPPAVTERIAASRRLHGSGHRAGARDAVAAGATCRPHGGRFLPVSGLRGAARRTGRARCPHRS